MKIQYVSQIFNAAQHLPFSALIQPAAPVLVLAGNCVQPWTEAGREFLKNAAHSFDKVYVVPGPAEYGSRSDVCYKKNMDQLYIAIYKHRNVFFMNNHTFDIDPAHTIAGTTLWNHLIGTPPPILDLEGINTRYETIDKKIVFNTIQKQAVRDMHIEGRNYLRSVALNPENCIQKLAFVTYYVPTFEVLTDEDKVTYDTAIMANNELFYCEDPLDVWISGAGAGSKQVQYKNVRIVKNAYGFAEAPAPSFSKEAVVELA
jgi:hypothetical protein